MRFFCYEEPNEIYGTDDLVVVSEDEIRKTWYPVWHDRMIKKYGEGSYWFEDALDDWILTHGAWESTDC